MSTVATDQIKTLARKWETDCGYRSARCSGIIGDDAHRRRGGYHIARRLNPAGNYSIVRPQDRGGCGPDDASTAVDMTMSTADMILCTTRLAAVHNSTTDPRRKYLNAFNGWTGTGDARRYDVYARRTMYASPDHKWHVHLEIRRIYATSWTATNAILSILRGETAAEYLTSIGVVPEQAPPVVMPPKPGPPKPAVAAPAAPAPGRTAPAAPPVKAAPVRPKPPAYPGRVMRRNTSTAIDHDLRKWQQRMRERGWKSVTADGLFGPKTESAVRRFQGACKVPVDGRIGPQTWPLPWTRPLGG